MIFERNITCLRCNFRHPASRSCAEARRLSDEARVRRWKRMAAIALQQKACPHCGGDCSDDVEPEDPTEN